MTRTAMDGADRAEMTERDGVVTVRVLTARGEVLVFRFTK